MSDEDKNENLDSLNETAGEADTNQDGEETSANEESEDVAKLKELNKKLYERAKKAETEAKELKKSKPETKPEPQSDELSQKDLIALIRADVADDDISEVADYAKLKKISVAEALKTSFIKSLLKDKQEERKSAEVAASGSVKRASNKVSDETLLARIEKGVFPESDEEIQRLVELRMKARKKS